MSWLIPGIIAVAGVAVAAVATRGIKTINPRYRGLIERLGKYKKLKQPGLAIIIPFIDKLRYVDITEKLASVDAPEIITKDALNLQVKAQIYFKVKDDETSIKNSQYNVYNFEEQIVQLATTTLRKIIGTKTFVEANTERTDINEELKEELEEQAKAWGVAVLRAELRELTPTQNVQEAMNNVMMAMQAKNAAIDNATAAETVADGLRRAAIKKADGEKQAKILEAQGDAKAIVAVAEAEAKKIKLESEAIEKYFTEKPQAYKKMQMVVESLKNNTKVIAPDGASLVNLLSDAGGITPIPVDKPEGKK